MTGTYNIEFTKYIRDCYDECIKRHGHGHPTTEFARMIWLYEEKKKYQPKCGLFQFFKKPKMGLQL
jgi:hypothetical protein